MPDICLDCINDEALCEIVSRETDEVECSYCGKMGQGIAIEKLTEIVDEPLRNYCCIGYEHLEFEAIQIGFPTSKKEIL